MKANTEGYYELTLNNGRKKCNTIILENSETKEKLPIKILGTYKEGLVEELISWIKLKHISMIDIIKDRRLFETSEEEIIIKEILPEDEYFVYSSEPYYEDAIKVSEDEFNYEYQKIRSIPNGMKQYREKVETLINSTVINYIIAKNHKNVLIEEETSHIEEQNNDKITEPGYYKLTISDGRRYHKKISITKELELPIIGEYKDGELKIVITDIILEFIRKVTETKDRRTLINGNIITLPKDDYHSYFNKPCYIKGKIMDNMEAKKILEILENNPDILIKYITTINEIIKSSTTNYKIIQSSIINNTTVKNKKPRNINPCKNKEKTEVKHISRKLKKKMKLQEKMEQLC